MNDRVGDEKLDVQAVPPGTSSHASQTGVAIRQLRKARGMTIQQLAAALDRSAGYISQVERGLSEPTLKDIYAVSTVFNVGMSWFVLDAPSQEQSEAEREHVVRRDNRRTMNQGGIVTQLLSPAPDHKLEFMMSTFPPGAETEVKNIRNPGNERGIILQGRLELHVDDNTFMLDQGDSYLFQRSTRYWSRNPSDQEQTVVLWVSSL